MSRLRSSASLTASSSESATIARVSPCGDAVPVAGCAPRAASTLMTPTRSAAARISCWTRSSVSFWVEGGFCAQTGAAAIIRRHHAHAKIHFQSFRLIADSSKSGETLFLRAWRLARPALCQPAVVDRFEADQLLGRQDLHHLNEHHLARLVDVRSSRFDAIDLTRQDGLVGVLLNQVRELFFELRQLLPFLTQFRSSRFIDSVDPRALVGGQPQIPFEWLGLPPEAGHGRRGWCLGLDGSDRGVRQDV